MKYPFENLENSENGQKELNDVFKYLFRSCSPSSGAVCENTCSFDHWESYGSDNGLRDKNPSGDTFKLTSGDPICCGCRGTVLKIFKQKDGSDATAGKCEKCKYTSIGKTPSRPQSW
jgi:hypothetical protein